MKRIVFFLNIFFLVIGCDKNVIDPVEDLADGFCIVSNDKVILNRNDFEYYDFSTHLIYLKNDRSFTHDLEETDDFSVYADKTKIYSGQTLPGYSSFLPVGPVIHTFPVLYPDYILSLGFIRIIDSLGNSTPDPRTDARIIEALKKYHQFHSGLHCEINSVQFTSPNHVVIELKLENDDSFNYYYLDPDKMGIDLFHYFTNGLQIRNLNFTKVFTHKVEVLQPEPWNSWKKDWLSIIKSNETKIITLTYPSFENVSPGEYTATFVFPGLFQVDRDDIQQNDGRIWLGELSLTKDITIE